jgi:hypothetical protein
MPAPLATPHLLHETMLRVYSELCCILLGSNDVDGLETVSVLTRRCLDAVSVGAVAATDADVASAEHVNRSVQGVVEVAVAAGRTEMLAPLRTLAQGTAALASAARARAADGSVS